MYVHTLPYIVVVTDAGTSDLVVDTFPLSPPGIESHFGITRGHIHHVRHTLQAAKPFLNPCVQALCY